MLTHHLKIACRNLVRHRVSTFINVVGLSLGLTCFIATYIFIDYVRRADSHFANADRIYTVFQSAYLRAMELDLGAEPGASSLLAEQLTADLPGLVVARASGNSETIVSVDGRPSFQSMNYVDPELFQIFDLPFVVGAADNAARLARAAFLSEEAAEDMFGTFDVIGQTIQIEQDEDLDGGPLELPVEQSIAVAGVIGRIPEPSHLGVSFGTTGFDILVVTTVEEDLSPPSEMVEFWGEGSQWLFGGVNTYILMPEDGSLTLEQVNARLEALEDRVPEEMGRVEFEARPLSAFSMASLEEIGVFSDYWISVRTLLLLLAGVVLATACLNSIGLLTATSTARAKEAGMRKVLGAKRSQITRQQLLESAMIVGAAHVLALAMIQAGLPIVNASTVMTFAIPGLSSVGFWAFLVALAIAVTLCSGLYPALKLGRVLPARALSTGTTMSPSRFRTLLVGAQFTMSSFLLIGIIVIQMQNSALVRSGFGQGSDTYVVLQDRPRRAGITAAAFNSALFESPLILDVIGAGRRPWDMGWGGTVFSSSPDVAAEAVFTQHRSYSYNYLENFGVELLAGRWFTLEEAEELQRGFEEFEAREAAGEDPDDIRAELEDDPDDMQRVLLDIDGARQFGWDDPMTAVGGLIYNAAPGPGGEGRREAMEVIGVIDEPPFEVVGFGRDAFVVGLAVLEFSFPVIRISTENIPAALDHIDEVWSELAPHWPIRRAFMDERFEEAYSGFRKLSRGFLALTICALVIANMGLLGMAIFTGARRRHEVGVRKSLGAKFRQIMILFLADFSKPVLIANLIAWPVAYLAARTYLNIFVDRIPLTLTPFLLSLAVTVLIAWIAVGAQVLSAARTRPAEVLRYE